MMTIDEAVDRANDIYARRKLGKYWYEVAPESRPQIHSDQVLAVLEVLVEEIRGLRGLLASESRAMTTASTAATPAEAFEGQDPNALSREITGLPE